MHNQSKCEQFQQWYQGINVNINPTFVINDFRYFSRRNHYILIQFISITSIILIEHQTL